MGGNLSRGIILIAVLAVLALFAFQQWGTKPEMSATSAQQQTQVAQTVSLQQPQNSQEPPQEEKTVQATKTVQDTNASGPVSKKSMTPDEFKAEYRDWKNQKDAREGKPFQSAREEQRQKQTQEQALALQHRREVHERWRARMKEWQEQRREALQQGLPIPPRPSSSDIRKTIASEQ